MNRSALAFLLILSVLCIHDIRRSIAEPPNQPIAPPAAAPDPREVIARQIQQAIGDLDADDFHTRDAASGKLHMIGWPAMTPLIIAHAKTDDAEAKARIGALIEAISFRHTALTANVAALLSKYENADAATRLNMETFDFNRGDARFVLAQKRVLATGNTEPLSLIDGRKFLNDYGKSLRKAEAWDELEWDLITAALNDGPYLSNLIRPQLFQLARQQKNAALLGRALLALRKIQPAKQYAYGFDELIMQLLLVSGDTDEALKAAKITGVYGTNARLLLLSERRDWTAIANLAPDAKNDNLFDRAAALQFIGKRAEADALLKFQGRPFEENAVNFSGHHPMLLGRMDLATKLYVSQKDYIDAVCFLIMQRRYTAALAIVEKAKADHYDQAPAAESQMIPVFARLNEAARARALMKSLGGPLDKMNKEWVNGAIDEANAILGKDGGRQNAPPDAAVLFRSRAAEAGIWLEILKSDPGGTPAALKESARILNDGPTPDEISRLADFSPAAGDDARGAPPVLQTRPKLYEAYMLYKAGRRDLADKAMKNAIADLAGKRFVAVEDRMQNDFAPESPLDLIVSLKDWKFCRPLLEALGAPQDADPAFGFLLGVCLQRLGEIDAGTKIQRDANELIEPSVLRRAYLVSVLRGAGEIQLARDQAHALLDSDLQIDEIRYQTHDTLAQIAIDSGDFQEALEQIRLVVIGRLHYFHMPEDVSVYIRLPRQMAYCEARVALAKKDPAAAIAAAEQVPALDPEDLDLTLQLVAAFKQNGLNKEAAQLAARSRDLLEAILKDFPNSHLHHYLIAKLDHDSGFLTPQTRVHIQRALQLAPDNPTYIKLSQLLATQPPK